MKKALFLCGLSLAVCSVRAESVLLAHDNVGPNGKGCIEVFDIAENGEWSLLSGNGGGGYFADLASSQLSAYSADQFLVLMSDGDHIHAGTLGGRCLLFDRKGNFLRQMFFNSGNQVRGIAMDPEKKYVYYMLNSWGEPKLKKYVLQSGDLVSILFDTANSAKSKTIYSADGETSHTLNIPLGIAVTKHGTIWIADRQNAKLVKVDEETGALLSVVQSPYATPVSFWYDAETDELWVATEKNFTKIDSQTGANLGENYTGASGQKQGIIRRDDGTFYLTLYNTTSAHPIYKVADGTFNTQVAQSGYKQAYGMCKVPEEKDVRMLLSDTGNNRVLQLKPNASDSWELEKVFAEIESPRGIAAKDNHVYIAEGVEGGRIFDYKNKGGLRRTLCKMDTKSKPAALALSPDGGTLYVTECWSITAQSESNNTDMVLGTCLWAVDTRTGRQTLFADKAGGSTLYEQRGVAVNPENGNVYVSSRYKTVNTGSGNKHSVGQVALFTSDGTYASAITSDQAGAVCWDDEGTYKTLLNPANTISGRGVLFTINGITDIVWSGPSTLTSQNVNKICDRKGDYYGIIDIQPLDGRVIFTRPEQNELRIVTHYQDNKSFDRPVRIDGAELSEPTYMELLSEFPVDKGTVVMLQGNN